MATFDACIRKLGEFQNKSLDGALKGLQGIAATITTDMRTTHPHGNDTGATEAGYGARAVGRGESGAAAFAQEMAAAEQLNPGKTASGTVTISGVGVVIDSKTTYQKYLETEHAGRDAVLVPTLKKYASLMTKAAAEGAKRGLS